MQIKGAGEMKSTSNGQTPLVDRDTLILDGGRRAQPAAREVSFNAYQLLTLQVDKFAPTYYLEALRYGSRLGARVWQPGTTSSCQPSTDLPSCVNSLAKYELECEVQMVSSPLQHRDLRISSSDLL